MISLSKFIPLLLLVLPVLSTLGVSTGPVITIQDNFDCLKKDGYEFANVRAFSLEGADLDLSVKDTLIYAKRAGLHTDLFVRVCRGKSAKFQIDAIMLAIAEQYYDRFWLYVDDNPNFGCKWHSDLTSNCNYLKEMIKQIQYFDKPVGIHTTKKFWEEIFGGVTKACADLGKYPLIYDNNDKKPSFEGFQPFGGWTEPTMKIYQNDVSECNVTLNKIYKA